MNLRSLLMLALMAAVWMGGCTPTETSNSPDANASATNAPEGNSADANAPAANTPEANAPEANSSDASAAAKPDQPVTNAPDAGKTAPTAPDAAKPDEKKPDQISAKTKPDEETGKEDLVAKANEGKNPPKPPIDPKKPVTPPIKPPNKVSPIENLKKQANPATKASAFVGTWRFELPANKRKEIQEAMAKMASKNPAMKNLPIPESTITVNGDGTFVINEVLGQKRLIKGTYTVKDGMAILTYKTVNGKPPVARSDKAQHGLIITSSGDLKRSDTMTFKKK